MLYTIATPIGNIEDISLRAKRILEEVDYIAAEDTRVTKRLLSLLEISGRKTFISCHDHNEGSKAPYIVELLEAGHCVALVSDAGTPCIHDPGYRVVRLVHSKGIRVVPIPGCSSVTTFLSAVGVPASKFYFAGYLPKKKTAMQREIESWESKQCPVVFFETAPRVLKTLAILTIVYPDSKLSFGRELTKMYEEIQLGTLEETTKKILSKPSLKGEFVFMSESKNVLR